MAEQEQQDITKQDQVDTTSTTSDPTAQTTTASVSTTVQDPVAAPVDQSVTQDTTTAPVIQADAPVAQTADTSTTVQDTTQKDSSVPQVVDQGVADASVVTGAVVQDIKPIVINSIAVQDTKPTTADVTEQVAEVAPLSNFQKLMQRVATEGTVQQKSLVSFFQNYITELAPRKPQNPTKAINSQYALWETLKGVVTNPDNEEFRRQWFIVLAFFEEHKNGALGGAYVFRFADNWSRDKDGLNHNHRLINIIHCISNFENRKEGLKEVDLDRSLAGMFTEATRNRFINQLQQ